MCEVPLDFQDGIYTDDESLFDWAGEAIKYLKEVQLVERENIDTWMKGYIKAWNSNDPEDIGRLFSRDGRYFDGPFREPWRGRDQIISSWLEQKDEPGDFDVRYEVLGISENKGFVRGWTNYHNPNHPEWGSYSNLWVIQLNGSGECEEFIEWWMEP